MRWPTQLRVQLGVTEAARDGGPNLKQETASGNKVAVLNDKRALFYSVSKIIKLFVEGHVREGMPFSRAE